MVALSIRNHSVDVEATVYLPDDGAREFDLPSALRRITSHSHTKREALCLNSKRLHDMQYSSTVIHNKHRH